MDICEGPTSYMPRRNSMSLPNISVISLESAVQPTIARSVTQNTESLNSSPRSSASARRLAMRQDRRPCSRGCPSPRSDAKERAATTSTSRGAGCGMVPGAVSDSTLAIVSEIGGVHSRTPLDKALSDLSTRIYLRFNFQGRSVILMERWRFLLMMTRVSWKRDRTRGSSVRSTRLRPARRFVRASTTSSMRAPAG